jgi:rod shape-determining protein MreC
VKIYQNIKIFFEKRLVLINNKKITNLVFIISVFILIAVIGVTSSNYETKGISKAFSSLVAPVQKIFYSVGYTFSNSFDSLLNISKIREENNQLKERVYTLQEENLSLKYIVNNSEALLMEYEMIKNIEYDYEKSQIISRDLGNWFGRFTIDKGQNYGVKIDDIVIKAIANQEGLVKMGLVGKVTDVGENWAKVVVINDVNSSVSFKLLRNNESGVLKGTIEGTIEGYMFNQTDDLIIGDEIVTSGLGEVYVPNLYIGKISKIEKTSDLLTEEITIIPEVDFKKLYEVYIIKVNR